MLAKIKKILLDSCAIFTAFVFFLMSAYSIINLSAPQSSIGLSFKAAAVLFACATCMRVFHGIINVESIKIPIRIILHYTLIIGTAFCSLFIIRGSYGINLAKNSLAFFVILSFFTVVYLTFCLAFFAIKKAKQSAVNSSKEYTSILKK